MILSYTKLYLTDAISSVGFPGGSGGKESVCNAGDLGREDSLEKEMTTHFSNLAWRIPWTEEPGRHSDGVVKSQT